MSEQTAKPYLVRALYQWCTEHAYTPYLVVQVDEHTRVPSAYVKNGQITLNVSDTAVHRLTMDNNWVLFNARFNGATQEVAVPMSAVIGIYARETGYGMGFTVTPPLSETEGVPIQEVPATPPNDAAGAQDPTSPSDPNKPPRPRGHLSVVK